MIDPLDSLAFSLHHNKGVYTLLLGSGISRSAMIPTGWDIIRDLTRKLAQVTGENCDTDPEAWYRAKFGEEPNYSKLIQGLARSQSERSQLLRPYFEPNEQEREQGLKMPTPAHHSIARLSASGHIRIIVTTNFDRLLESALQEVGVVPTVISTPDALAGARPLQHTECTILKLHGDYMDTRIKNTPQELERYTHKMNQLLDRILDEYGLIVCGWSAEWDVALRGAIERCHSHRFTTYWTVRGKPNAAAEKLIMLRRAEIVSTTGADDFFTQLAEKVASLSALDQPHPLSVKTAVATVKRYIAHHSDRIALHDLVIREAENVRSRTGAKDFPISHTTPFNPDLLVERLTRYEAVCEMLQAMLIVGCYWSEPEQDEVWARCLERVALPQDSRGGVVVNWQDLTLYPALLLLYAGGLAAISGGRNSTLAAILTSAKAQHPSSNRTEQLVLAVNTGSVTSKIGNLLPGRERDYMPGSDYLHDVLRPAFKELVPNDEEYDDLFDRFEYIQNLVYSDLYEKQQGHGRVRAPLGRFFWRGPHLRPGEDILERVGAEIAKMGDTWTLLQAGLFDGSLARLTEIKGKLDEFVQQRRDKVI
jgi:hypothetical protein